MLSWFKRKRPLPEAASPPLNEIDQEISTATTAGDDEELEAAIDGTETVPVATANFDEEIPKSSAAAETESLALHDIGAGIGGDVDQAIFEKGFAKEVPPAEEERESAGRTAAISPSVDQENNQGTPDQDDERPTAESVEASSPPAERAPLFAASQAKPTRKTSFFSRLAERLSRTRESFTNQLDQLLYGRKEIDRALFDQLEELLITADLGYATTQEILDAARQRVKHQDTDNPRALRDAIRDKMFDYLTKAEQAASLTHPQNGPFVVMAVGINGVGKTTTIGKIAHKFRSAGYSVLLVAADTFRAAAVSQLKIWGERGGIHVMAKEDGSDPSSVVFDALAHAVAKNYDVVLVDTAGRLHTQQHLMEELKKIKRVMAKKLPGAPHEVLLVLDATTGQNAIAQARIFNEAVGVTGVALTKLDGTAKGGIVVNVSKELGAPIRFIGVGEQLADLRDFDAREFIDALFDGGSERKA